MIRDGLSKHTQLRYKTDETTKKYNLRDIRTMMRVNEYLAKAGQRGLDYVVHYSVNFSSLLSLKF